MIQLSKRLQAVVQLVTPGNIVADIGCDHAYISIYLMEQEIAKKVIAMDINRGPLERADENIKKAGLQGKIETRLSDGAKELKQEVDTILMAGMGGHLMRKILEDSINIVKSVSELVLQPQSEVRELRLFLETLGFQIEKEDMVLEDGKYYTMMRARNAYVKERKKEIPLNIEKKELYARYGKYLLENRNQILKRYLKKELKKLDMILRQLEQSDLEKNQERYQLLKQAYQYCKEGNRYYETKQ